MNDLKLFDFNDHLVRMRVDENGNPWWIAKDVCDVLELEHITNTLSRLEEDEKLTVTILQSGQGRQMWVINESGLYNLIFQSRKPEAKAFRKWVTKEVLPNIRKTGSYKINKDDLPKYPLPRKNANKSRAMQLYLDGFTVEEIAKKMEVSDTTVYRWKREDGENEMTDWDAIAEIIDMPLPVLAKVYAYSIKKCIFDMKKNTDELKDSKAADAITKHIAILKKIDPAALVYIESGSIEDEAV
ncbi:MAG TPA: DUF1804 family protein [Spirochaetota bacterium]|nr:DUF1804 family protein [Spirochaetota bacterium]